MDANEWKKKAYELTEQLEEHLQEMCIRGNKSSECQRTNIQITLNELDAKINAVYQADFFEEGTSFIAEASEIKSEYVNSEVTSGEFIYSLVFPLSYGIDNIISDVQAFLDWDDSDEEFEVVEKNNYFIIE